MKKIILLFCMVTLSFCMNVTVVDAAIGNIDKERIRNLIYLEGFEQYVDACKNGNLEEAKYNLDQMIYNYPNETYLYYLRALILVDFKSYADARNDLVYYIECNPEDIEGYKLNMYVCFEDNNYEEAMYCCQRGLEINPDNTYLLKYQKKLSELLDNQKKQAQFENVGAGDNSYYLQQILQFINEKRKKANLNEVETNAVLNQAATKRASELITEFSHTRPDGTPFLSVLKEFEIPYHFAGEVAYKRSGTPEETIKEWINSYSSKEFGIDPDTKYVGIGIAEENGITYLVQIFMF